MNGNFRAAWIGSAVIALGLAAQTSGDEPAPGALSSKIPGVSEQMKKFIADNQIAGAVTLVTAPGEVLYLDAVGFADIKAQRPMRSDSMFWIASMTKPITGTAVMMLQDQGKLSVDDPVEKYLPEFAALKTKEGKPAKLTIRHLLTHTSGMAEIAPDQSRSAHTLADAIPFFVAQPVQFEPGSQWTYCQSSLNTAGRIVEVVSGKSLPDFLDEQLFGPLGMKDTTFYLNEAQLGRLATPYRRTPQGELVATDNFILGGKSPTSRDRFPAANGGLFSTATDYARFCQMILTGGELGGRRFLRPENVRLMTSVQTGDLKTGFTPGNGWGLGWCVVREPQGVSATLASGSFGHGGAYGTQAWIDPEKKLAYILMVQRADFPNADASDVRRAFQQQAADALKDRKD